MIINCDTSWKVLLFVCSRWWFRFMYFGIVCDHN